MLRSRAVQGSFAASAAVACALGLASTATGAVGGFGGLLLHDQARCCSPVAAGDGIATGVGRPGARPFAVGSLAQASGSLESGSGEATGAPEPEDEPETEDDGGKGAARALPFRGPDALDQTFEGSAKPAGPDLTLPEEQQLITGGWN